MNNANHAVWDEAAQEINCFLGTKETFDPEADTEMPLPEQLPQGPTMPPRISCTEDEMPHSEQILEEHPRPRPTVSTAPRLDDASRCAEEEWIPPSWLHVEYVPQYEYDLPPGIRVPTVETTTYVQVVINEDDDIARVQIAALRALVARHPHLFDDGKGCVREPIKDWLRLL
jgi:hypothetical protein